MFTGNIGPLSWFVTEEVRGFGDEVGLRILLTGFEVADDGAGRGGDDLLSFKLL